MAERDGRDLAELLLRKARGDERAVSALLDEHVPDEVVGFHAQQAVEKALKAVLAVRGIDYAFSHDLAYLGDLLTANGIDLPADVRAGEELRPWAVEFRYEDPAGTPPLDRRGARDTAEAALRWAAEFVSPGS